MISGHNPVVLVHGWKSHPGVWDQLAGALEERSIPFWNFDHSMMKGDGVPEIAQSLHQFILEKRVESGFSGPVDMVCHSMGTGIARYLVEVRDGKTRLEKVRLLIGLGPPNNGSSLAEIFFDPEYGPRVLLRLGGIFVPRRFNPADDIIVRQFRPESVVMQAIKSAGLRDDISYRLILTENRDAIPEFFPAFRGKTVVFSGGTWIGTYEGDGIVPHEDSWLCGAGYDILPEDPRSLIQHSPELYCHLHLPRNPEVIRKIVEYLSVPDSQPENVCQYNARNHSPERTT